MTSAGILDTAPDPSMAGGRALVLGGGGSTGNAWLIGVIAGLADAGLDVVDADLTIGTSAGATAAAQIAGERPTTLYRDILLAAPPPRSSTVRSESPSGVLRPVADHLDRMRRIIAASADAADLRRRIGAAALERETGSDPAWQAQWRATVASRLPNQDWPERRVVLTAIDAETGEPILFDRSSGVDLVDAVAASCSSGLPYRIAGRPCLDGGFRSNAENADLAAGAARVLLLAPFGFQSLVTAAWGTHLASQVDSLRAAGSDVEVIVPDRGAEAMFGANAMDPSLRAPAARSGYALGQAQAGRLAQSWG